MSQGSSASGERNFAKSVIYGIVFGGSFLVSILVIKELLIVLLAVAIAAGAWEISTALRKAGWYVPRLPVTIGSLIIMPATYFGGAALQWARAQLQAVVTAADNEWEATAAAAAPAPPAPARTSPPRRRRPR